MHLLERIRKIDIDTVANRLLVLYAFFLSFSKESYEFILSLLVILFIVRGDYKNHLQQALSNSVVLAFFLYFLLHIIGLLWTNDYVGGVRYIEQMRYFLLPIFVVTFLKYEYIGRVLSAFLLGMLVCEIYSYGLFFELLPNTRWGSPDYPNPFTTHINYSMLLAFTSILLLQKIFQDRSVSRLSKVFYILFFTTVTFNLFITGGRSGQVVFLLSVFLMIYLAYQKHFVKVAALGLFITGAVLVVAFNFSEMFQKRMDYALYDIRQTLKGDYSHSWGQRVASVIVSADIIKESPLLGHGTQGHIDVFTDKLKHEFEQFENIIHYYKHVHNQYLNVMLQFGVIGLLVMLNIFYRIGRYRQPDPYIRNIQLVLLFMTVLFSFWGRSLEGLTYYVFFISMTTFTLVIPTAHNNPMPMPVTRKEIVQYVSYGIIIFILSKITWLVSVDKKFALSDLF